MTLEVRRVITGHDGNGKARVVIDELSDNVISRRAGQQSTVIWATDQTPADLTVLNDFSIYQVSILIAICLLLMMYPIVFKIDFSQVIKSAKTPNLNCFYTTNY